MWFGGAQGTKIRGFFVLEGAGGVTYSKLALPIDPYPLCTTMPVIRPHSKYAQSLLPHIHATIYQAIYPTGKPTGNPQAPS